MRAEGELPQQVVRAAVLVAHFLRCKRMMSAVIVAEVDLSEELVTLAKLMVAHMRVLIAAEGFAVQLSYMIAASSSCGGALPFRFDRPSSV